MSREKGIRTIIVSNLESYMDHQYLHDCFGTMGEVTGVLLERNETTKAPIRAFVEFSTRKFAEEAMANINPKPRPDNKSVFYFNFKWAMNNLDRRAQGKNYLTYKSDESSGSDTAVTLEDESSDSEASSSKK